MDTVPPSDENIEHFRNEQDRAAQLTTIAAHVAEIGAVVGAFVGLVLMGLVDDGWQMRLRVLLICTSLGLAPGLVWLAALLVKYVREQGLLYRWTYLPPLLILIPLGVLWWITALQA